MHTRLIGPFSQLLCLNNLANKGPISDESLSPIQQGGVIVQGDKILKTGSFDELQKEIGGMQGEIIEVESEMVCLPGFVDAHTHICFGGSRARDYAMRNAGKSYLDIARAGGGIWDTVTQTRKASQEELVKGLSQRASRQVADGITTIEVKSGYGLTPEEELKMLQAIKLVDEEHVADLVPTCLAAHIFPKDFTGNKSEYLAEIIQVLLPEIQAKGLSKRVDIFVEETAFEKDISATFLSQAKAMGFELTLHADQFSAAGSALAVEQGAISADHLEASGEKEIAYLSKSEVVPVVLPGASMGLGEPFAPARKLLDAGCSLAIASDWNPGSAPMGKLLLQAAVLGAYQKLSNAEVFAALTFRAARTLALSDRGKLQVGMKADFISFPGKDYREILYQQGSLQVARVWKNGQEV